MRTSVVPPRRALGAPLNSGIFEKSGRMAALRYSGETTEIRTNLVLPARGWKRTFSLPAEDTVFTEEGGDAAVWRGSLDRLRFVQRVRDEGAGIVLDVNYSAAADLDVEGLFLRIDLPWLDFASGTAGLEGGRTAALPADPPARPDLLRGTSSGLAAASADSLLNWTARFDRRVPVNLQHKSGESPRAYTFWVYLHNGRIAAGTQGSFEVRLTAAGIPDAAPARLTLDAGSARYRFHGFGGNYCFGPDSPVARYTLDNLDVRWGRVEMSLDEWEPAEGGDHGDRPGSRIRAQLEMARELDRRRIPYVVSVWRVPERMYAAGGRGRIHPARWDELLESISSYLLWARERYGAEPVLFSFNEPDIGVNVCMTPEEHRDGVKAIGARLERDGLRTRMLLGDVHSPRGTERYVLPAAADVEAMRYAGGLSFHSWGGATPQQYAAWSGLSQRLGLPLLAAETGTDPEAWRGRGYDSFLYGMGESRVHQELLLHACPRAILYWEFTSDYSLLANDLAPTRRFWLMRHLTDLTPPMSDALATASDHPKVLFTAFRGPGRYAFHILNSGAGRDVRLEGVPPNARDFRAVRTSETASFLEFPLDPPAGETLSLTLPGRSLTTISASAGEEKNA